jgi:ligand-binding sensor protein/AraC-like DNA-binding protein
MAEKFSVSDIIQINFVDKLLFLFTDITQMGVSVLDSSFKKVKYSHCRCEFCYKISKTYYKKCHESDRRGCELAVKYGRPYIYQCFAGLTEIAIPILENGKPLGYIITGQVLTNAKDDVNRQYLSAIKKQAEAKRLVDAIPRIDQKLIKDMAHILFMIIDFIISKRAYLVLEDVRGTEETYNLKVDSAKKFIEEKFYENIKLSDVARHVGLSACYFSKLFKKFTRRDYQQYLITKRLSKAQELLKDPDSKITEVAYNSGFNDSNYFSFIFGKTYGVSPREFRAKVLKEKKPVPEKRLTEAVKED